MPPPIPDRRLTPLPRTDRHARHGRGLDGDGRRAETGSLSGTISLGGFCSALGLPIARPRQSPPIRHCDELLCSARLSARLVAAFLTFISIGGSRCDGKDKCAGDPCDWLDGLSR